MYNFISWLFDLKFRRENEFFEAPFFAEQPLFHKQRHDAKNTSLRKRAVSLLM